MNILSLDTSMQACSAAVLLAGRDTPVLFSDYVEIGRGHAERLMPMIAKIVKQAGIGYSDLDRIAVTTGPGTFTGVRIGVAAARGLALAASRALVGETSLRLIAARYLREYPDHPAGRPVSVAVDARRNQIYFQLFAASDAEPLGAPKVLSARQAAKLLPPDGQAIIVGSGAGILAEAAELAGNDYAAEHILNVNLQPHAGDLARLAIEMPPWEGPINPLYLRPPDAKPQMGAAVVTAQ